VMPHMLPPQQRMQVGICGVTCDQEAEYHQKEEDRGVVASILPLGQYTCIGQAAIKCCGGALFGEISILYNTISISCGLELSMLPEGCEVCPRWLYNRARS